jgi:hypothetical protein
MSTVGMSRNTPDETEGQVASLYAGPGHASNSTSAVNVSTLVLEIPGKHEDQF